MLLKTKKEREVGNMIKKEDLIIENKNNQWKDVKYYKNKKQC